MKLANTLYSKYMKQRSDASILENGTGFIVYKINQDECFIIDMYVDDQLQQTGRGKELINALSDLARFEKCKYISANIHLTDKNANKTLVSALHTGFKVVKAELGILVILKEI